MKFKITIKFINIQTDTLPRMGRISLIKEFQNDQG